MGQGQSAPSGIPAAAAAPAPPTPTPAQSKNSSKQASAPANVLAGQTGGKGSRHLRQRIRNKHMKSRKNRANRSMKH